MLSDVGPAAPGSFQCESGRAVVKSHARVVIIGGGVIGTSTLYHLAHLGWTDAVLLEKGELASGTSWHAAGFLTQMNGNHHLARIATYSVDLYKRLEAETGQSTGIRDVGSLRLATTKERLDEFKVFAGRAASLGIPYEIVSPTEARELAPVISTDGLVAGAFIATDAYCDPTMLTNSLAAGARRLGAEVERRTLVTGTRRLPSGEWLVETDRGTITCEILVNAAGQWARDVGRWVGVDLPVVPYEHMYVVFDAMPSGAALAKERPTMREPEGSFYARQEGHGLLVGGYEADARAWMPEHVPTDFESDLLPPDLERIASVLEAAFHRYPGLEHTGAKKIYNGPDGYTPDHRFLMGEVPGRPGYFVLAGFNSLGIVAAGGAGRHLAEWIADGEPSADMSPFDVRRYGEYTLDTSYRTARIDETYLRHYDYAYPGHETHVTRKLKTDPLYDRLVERGAVMGERFGWERPLWFAPSGVEPVDVLSFRRHGSFEHVGAECRAVRERVGIIDQTSFAKFDVTGPGAAAFLDRIASGHLPREDGRLAYTLLLTESGGVESDLTITRLTADHWYVVTAAAAESRDRVWLEHHLPDDGSVRLQTVTGAWGVLSVAGPRSRELLGRVSRADFSNAAFPFRAAREIRVGYAPVRALRVSYSGELGWELHVPTEYLRHVYDTLIAAGTNLGIADYGYRALDSLRLEKGYPLWGDELNPARSPDESGMARFVAIDKGEFVGRDGLLKRRAVGLTRQLACLVIDDAPGDGGDAVPFGTEPVYDGDRLVGVLDTAGYGHTIGSAIGYSVLPNELRTPGTRLEVAILGIRRPATVRAYPLIDPAGAHPRS